MSKLVAHAKRIFAKHGKPKFRSTYAENPRPVHILDIGVANASYAECKHVYPTSIYHGLDISDIDFELDVGDIFVRKNLEDDCALDSFLPIYDLIIINHVMEHINNGALVFKKLAALLRLGGVLYAEFPSIRTSYRKQIGSSYHFHEDPTHKTFYVLEDLANIAMKSGCQIVSCGPVSDPPLKILISGPRALFNMFRGRGFFRFLPWDTRKIDHILIKKISNE